MLDNGKIEQSLDSLRLQLERTWCNGVVLLPLLLLQYFAISEYMVCRIKSSVTHSLTYRM